MKERDAVEVITAIWTKQYYRETSTADLKESLFEEIKGRLKEDDESFPYLYNGYSVFY
jgi:oligopeptidase B